MSTKGFVFISDREKGISDSVSQLFPNGFQTYCCQHIADNMVQQYSIKYWLLFWKYTYTKTQVLYQVSIYIKIIFSPY
jgi:hypothetical protein